MSPDPVQRPRVLVARRLFDDVLEPLRQAFDVQFNPRDDIASAAELRTQLADKDGVLITASERIDAALLDACPRLRAVATMTVGFDHIDVAACAARGVVVTHAPDVLTETTADFGMALLLGAARQLGESERYLRAGRWKSWSADLFAGSDVHGTTLGIVGMGRIGRAIARRAALGFGMRVLYHNRKPLEPAHERESSASWRSLDELLEQSDHVMLALPYSESARHLIGAGQLARMRRGATLVNIGRGGLVDEPALAAALHSGHLGAAGLDVFEGEPVPNPVLLDAPRLLITPHIASASLPTRRDMVRVAMDNLLAVLRGGEALNPVPGAPRAVR